jgi:AcrR family transcriptional regulator
VPRISAANIAEHVQQQEDAILKAAARLFAEKGVAGTEIGDIAKAVGLARPSLYRYFPDKDHILLRWFERELAPVIERSDAIIDGPGSPEERLIEWMDFQLDFVQNPEHDLAPMLTREIGAVSADVQAAIGEGHARLYGTLRRLVDEALAAAHRPRTPRRDAAVVTGLLGGLLQAAAQSAIAGANPRHVRTELHRASMAVLAGA